MSEVDVLALLTQALHGVAFLIGLFLFSRLFIRPLADAVGGGDTAAIESLREEVMSKLASVEVVGPDGAVARGGMSHDDLDIPGLFSDSDEMTLQEQVDRLAQLRSEDSVRTIRGWMATGGA